MLVTVVVAGLLGAGVWAVIGYAASFSSVARAVARAGPWWLTASLAGAAVGYLGYALLYQALARVSGGPRPPLRLAVRLTVAVFGASVIATSAGRLGSEYWSLRRMHERAPQAWSRTLALNTAGWAILAALALVGALSALVGGTTRVPVGLAVGWALVLPACMPPALFLSSPEHRRWGEDRGGPVRRTVASALRGVTLLRDAAGEPGTWWRALAGGLIYWGGELVTVWAALQAFGVHLGYGPVVLAYATGYAATMLPLPAGGAGGVDAAAAYALTLVGVPLGPALLAVLVQRSCTFWLPLGVALVRARAIKRLPEELAAVPASSAPDAVEPWAEAS